MSLSFYHHGILLKFVKNIETKKNPSCDVWIAKSAIILFKLTLRCKNGQQGSHSIFRHLMQRLQTCWKDFRWSLSVEGSKRKDRSSTCCLLRDKARFMHKSAKIIFSRSNYFVSENYPFRMFWFWNKKLGSLKRT